MREYKMTLATGGNLYARISDRNIWTCEIKGAAKWYPVQQSDDPVWISNRKWDGLPKTFEIEAEAWNEFRQGVQQQEGAIEHEKQNPPNVPDRIKKVGDRILKHGNVIKFLTLQAQRNHKGDSDVIKHLLASVASTNSLTSSGIQPGITGEKGGGKTDCARATFHLIPDSWKLDASVTAKIPFYLPMKDGLIIFSDDVEWSTELIHTLKRAMGRFQTRQKHLTLDTDRNPVEKEMAARLAWWLSSVESVADDQLMDRQYSLDVEDDEKHALLVSDYIRESRASKIVKFSVDWRIEVARYILSKIKDHEPFKVIIPCAAAANWKIIKDHRTQNKFWDLVEAIAIIRYMQRHIDQDGWLYATKADFEEALDLFTRRKANHETHLTNAQTAIVEAVIALGENATQAEIAKRLKKSQQAISKGVKAIIANTHYIIETRGGHGELYYEATVIGLEVLYKGGFVSLPDSYNDLQPGFNPVSTILTTNNINNSKYSSDAVQPIQREYEDICACEKKNPVYAREGGCKVVERPHDSDNGSCKPVDSGYKTLTDAETALIADEAREAKFTLKKCDECGRIVKSLYVVGEGEGDFESRMCKTCYEEFMEDVGDV